MNESQIWNEYISFYFKHKLSKLLSTMQLRISKGHEIEKTIQKINKECTINALKYSDFLTKALYIGII